MKADYVNDRNTIVNAIVERTSTPPPAYAPPASPDPKPRSPPTAYQPKRYTVDGTPILFYGENRVYIFHAGTR